MSRYVLLRKVLFYYNRKPIFPFMLQCASSPPPPSLVCFAGILHVYDLFFYKYKLFIMFYHAHLIQLLLIHFSLPLQMPRFFLMSWYAMLLSHVYIHLLSQQHSFYMLNYYYHPHHHQRCRRSCHKTSTWRAKSKWRLIKKMRREWVEIKIYEK